jgi:hypothetical protein
MWKSYVNWHFVVYQNFFSRANIIFFQFVSESTFLFPHSINANPDSITISKVKILIIKITLELILLYLRAPYFYYWLLGETLRLGKGHIFEFFHKSGCWAFWSDSLRFTFTKNKKKLAWTKSELNIPRHHCSVGGTGRTTVRPKRTDTITHWLSRLLRCHFWSLVQS